MDENSTKPDQFATLTTDIIAAYVGHNNVQASDLPRLIADVFAALKAAADPKPAVAAPARATPSEIRRSITHDVLISFEDGKPYKTLRRHLTLRGLTPEAYRQKWGLPVDYPMTSASYSKQRSELAQTLGLGQQRRRSLRTVTEAADEASGSDGAGFEAEVGAAPEAEASEAPAARPPRRGGRKAAARAE
ncbi:MucR family transcriptional regulator [Methylobacterium oryzihabitans]|uniref:MucR family transcriptional regulator n=1 Tax=Methylobacterium oryzihabitans TaxID=2499852 RepID=A0A3S2V5I7_9HYPH|nr:MucR family transcriptional regulator [Methylobacterium oryzihabitans]RVU14078.1 MucR family transcriptional regulator [Methylobacterium oryzihabitans]